MPLNTDTLVPWFIMSWAFFPPVAIICLNVSNYWRFFLLLITAALYVFGPVWLHEPDPSDQHGALGTLVLIWVLVINLGVGFLLGLILRWGVRRVLRAYGRGYSPIIALAVAASICALSSYAAVYRYGIPDAACAARIDLKLGHLIFDIPIELHAKGRTIAVGDRAAWSFDYTTYGNRDVASLCRLTANGSVPLAVNAFSFSPLRHKNRDALQPHIDRLCPATDPTTLPKDVCASIRRRVVRSIEFSSYAHSVSRLLNDIELQGEKTTVRVMGDAKEGRLCVEADENPGLLQECRVWWRLEDRIYVLVRSKERGGYDPVDGASSGYEGTREELLADLRNSVAFIIAAIASELPDR
ncbi:MAG: hypothetical protein AAGC79_03345 [Pseudomonadota bacterium]